jgi:hypothetical protein
MIGWLYPAALAGLAAIAGPVLVHLLRRQRAALVLFPSLRFLESSRTAAVRLRLPSDLLLLAIRVAIVAAAALALAQPILRTEARERAWSARTVRAIVVDASASMSPAATAANEAAAAEASGSADAVTIDAPDLLAGVKQAIQRLDSMPPGRRELVVISDFRLGSLDGSVLAGVPSHVGIRFVTMGKAVPQATYTGALMGGPGLNPRQQTVTLTTSATSVAVREGGSIQGGLRLLAPPREHPAVDRLLRAVARAGAPAPSADEPLAIVFPGIDAPPSSPMTARWMLRTIAGMREHLRRTLNLDSLSTFEPATDGRGVVIARSPVGAPIISAAAAGNELVLSVQTTPGEFSSAAIVRAALMARVDAERPLEHEVARVPPEQLAAWTRAPGAPPPGQWRHAVPGDARYFWAAALILLAIESAARRARRVPVEAAEEARAA